jgi:hypothetical protein
MNPCWRVLAALGVLASATGCGRVDAAGQQARERTASPAPRT